jgi:hypothetical protein
MTLPEALASLQQQSIERGFGGRLSDIDVRLCEDGRTVSVWAFAQLDEPLMAHFDLSKCVTAAEFNPGPIQELCEHATLTLQ